MKNKMYQTVETRGNIDTQNVPDCGNKKQRQHRYTL